MLMLHESVTHLSLQALVGRDGGLHDVLLRRDE